MQPTVKANATARAPPCTAVPSIVQTESFRSVCLRMTTSQAAVKLFSDVCMELYHELIQQGPYSKELLPLIHAEDADVRALLTDVVFLANKLIISEYHIRAARDQDPRCCPPQPCPIDAAPPPLPLCSKKFPIDFGIVCHRSG